MCIEHNYKSVLQYECVYELVHPFVDCVVKGSFDSDSYCVSKVHKLFFFSFFYAVT